MDRVDIVCATKGQKISFFEIGKVTVIVELEKMSLSHQN